MQSDVVIFGGGAAGLWLLDELTRRGTTCLLLETGELGQGRTAGSQGSIHGGSNDTLEAPMTGSATGICELPGVWKACLDGTRQPDLSSTHIRSDCSYVWQSESVSSRPGVIDAQVGLHVAAESISPEQRPDVLRDCPGTVTRIDEQVVSPVSLLANLSAPHTDRILKIDALGGLDIVCGQPGQVSAILLTHPKSKETLMIEPSTVVLTAGAGNAELRSSAGLSAAAIKRSPLHMVMLRGPLPRLNGHCVDGARTRVTITSDRNSLGQTVWQLGGQLAEDGVPMDESALIAHARHELETVIPGFDFSRVEWATYRVDRAQAENGLHPESVQVLREGNVVTGSPTKLALVPQLVASLVETITPIAENQAPATYSAAKQLEPIDWPRPYVALPPWETVSIWHRALETATLLQRAA